MGKTATNLSLVLGIVTVAFAGFYLYTQNGSVVLSTNTNEQAMQNMLKSTQVYQQRSIELSLIDLNIGFFEDERLLSLESYTSPIDDRPSGRSNPFSQTSVSRSVSY